MSTRSCRNRGIAKREKPGCAGERRSDGCSGANAEITDRPFSSHDWKRVILSLAPDTVIATAISYVVLYLAMKAEAVHDGFPTSWVQMSLKDLMRLIPGIVVIFSALWYFAPFLASFREKTLSRSRLVIVGRVPCYVLAVLSPVAAAALLVVLLSSIGASELLCCACYLGLFIGFIPFLRYVCKRTRRQLPSNEKAAWRMVGIDGFLGLMAMSAWCCLTAFGGVLAVSLGIRIATIESMAFVSGISVILVYLFVPDMGKIATRELLVPFAKGKRPLRVALISLAVLVSFSAVWTGWNGLTDEYVVKHRETNEVFIVKAEYADNDCVVAPAVCGDDGSYSAKDEGVFTKINLVDGYETVQE